jgi:ABC-type bacteriocin/lantibiotic exporter with double-glycine peptidase domain
MIMELAGTTKEGGTPIKGIIKVAQKFGLKTQAKRMTLLEIKNFINRGIPVIMPLQAWTKKKKINWQKNWSDGHYVVAIGYDKQKIYFEDPGNISRTYLTYGELADRWHDMDSHGKKYINYGLAIYGKKPKYNLNKAVHMD